MNFIYRRGENKMFREERNFISRKDFLFHAKKRKGKTQRTAKASFGNIKKAKKPPAKGKMMMKYEYNVVR